MTHWVIVKDRYSQLVFPHHMHKITNLKILLHWSSKLQTKMKRYNLFLTNLCAFMCLRKLQAWSIARRNYIFPKNTMLLQREPFLTTALNCSWQVSFYANNYFEYLPIVSSALIWSQTDNWSEKITEYQD